MTGDTGSCNAAVIEDRISPVVGVMTVITGVAALDMVVRFAHSD